MPETEVESPAAVRFRTADDIIEPQSSIEQTESSDSTVNPVARRGSLSEEAQEELRNISLSIQKSKLQAARMENFSYDPVSLPTSRVSHNPIPNNQVSLVLLGFDLLLNQIKYLNI